MTRQKQPANEHDIEARRRTIGPNQTARTSAVAPMRPSGWSKVTLANGLRLILLPRPGSPTVAVRAYLRAGSRYDAEHRLPGGSDPALGLAHLVEHMLFKGTRHHSQRHLFAAVERLGGTLDAATAKEYLCVSAVVPPRGVGTALDIVAEVLAEPALDEEDFWNEKLVVLAEMRRAQDRQDRIYDLFAEALWQEHPLRCPCLGTLPALQAIDHASLLAFYRKRIVAGNMVLVLCGDLDPGEAGAQAAEYFSALPAGAELRPEPVQEPPLVAPRAVHLERDMHQMVLLLGVPTVGMAHPDRSALKVVERVLGMGGSSRLYQRLREERRLVYSVQTVTALYEDAGYLAAQCACDPQNLAQVKEVVLDEWQRLGREGVTDDELEAAQGNYAGTLARRFETNLAVAGIHGTEALLGEIEPFDAAVSRINAVTRDDVVRVAQAYLAPTRIVAATIGPGPGCGG